MVGLVQKRPPTAVSCTDQRDIVPDELHQFDKRDIDHIVHRQVDDGLGRYRHRAATKLKEATGCRLGRDIGCNGFSTAGGTDGVFTGGLLTCC